MDYGYTSGESGAKNDFQKLAQTVATNIQKISQNVSSIQKMTNQLGTLQETPQMENQLLEIQKYTQQLVKDTSVNIEDLKKIPNLPVHSEEYKQRKVQRERLLERFTDTLNQFQKVQCSTLQRRKEIYQQKQSDSGHDTMLPPPGSGNSRFTDHLIELQDQSSKQQTQQMIQEELNLQALEKQANSIRELESNIMDVNQIYKKLGHLVHEQGEMVDSIEANVELASVRVTEASKDINRAREDTNTLNYRPRIIKQRTPFYCLKSFNGSSRVF
ncbi:hypothetical protein RUM44_009436 [Polyplax serrata]|uniref:t-SNARE coiled-coil homology domain-containing protein n=1 Tax=Polyplax serrata TaxID=468196 RepID=A0ABR1ASQ1_POLSC